jgi:flagellar basal body-associated protein FliL
MSDEGAKPAEQAPKKSKVGLIIGLVVALITLVGGSVAGAVLGPKLLGGSEGQGAPAAKGGADAHAAKEAATTPEKIVSVDIPPIVVDLRDADGRLRHLKVGMAAELAEHANVDEFKLFTPRGREASLSYLRSLTFEEVSDPKRYALIKEELAKGFTEAVGAERVHRVLLIDFVLQ